MFETVTTLHSATLIWFRFLWFHSLVCGLYQVLQSIKLWTHGSMKVNKKLELIAYHSNTPKIAWEDAIWLMLSVKRNANARCKMKAQQFFRNSQFLEFAWQWNRSLWHPSLYPVSLKVFAMGHESDYELHDSIWKALYGVRVFCSGMCALWPFNAL